ncbi:hypothetical protein HDU96_008302 [Phlyctochytrium bullatum]|nr:hypothetical protein HDU96_008302 [Phlyctochytrium bullatum]
MNDPPPVVEVIKERDGVPIMDEDLRLDGYHFLVVHASLIHVKDQDGDPSQHQQPSPAASAPPEPSASRAAATMSPLSAESKPGIRREKSGSPVGASDASSSIPTPQSDDPHSARNSPDPCTTVPTSSLPQPQPSTHGLPRSLSTHPATSLLDSSMESLADDPRPPTHEVRKRKRSIADIGSRATGTKEEPASEDFATPDDAVSTVPDTATPAPSVSSSRRPSAAFPAQASASYNGRGPGSLLPPPPAERPPPLVPPGTRSGGADEGTTLPVPTPPSTAVTASSAETAAPPPTVTPLRHHVLVGQIVAACTPLPNFEGSQELLFLFTDLSVRLSGQFKIKFQLFDLRLRPSCRVLATVESNIFTSFHPKEFPGMGPSTDFSRWLARQGARIHIRTDVARQIEVYSSVIGSSINVGVDGVVVGSGGGGRGKGRGKREQT